MSVEPTLVSVLIPAFNAEKYLRETLASVANQTYRNLEIIVVDDGSSDGTGAIVQEFSRSDRRVRSVRQPNRGVAAARNHALSLARGELVAPIDADDLWHSRKIEKQLQKMVTAGQSVGLVYSWMCTISDVGLAIAFNRPADSGASPPLSRMVESNFVGCASVPLMRTATVREVGGYDETLRQARAGMLTTRPACGLTPRFAVSESISSYLTHNPCAAQTFRMGTQYGFAVIAPLPKSLYNCKVV
jgi:glycosyltransferase involved in cell wall biosynthesis